MKKYILPIIITLFTLFIAAKYIPLEQLSRIPKQITLKGLLIGVILYLISYVIVALRWRVLFAEGLGGKIEASPFLLLLMSGAHQFYGNFLPARTGDLTILYLAKKHLKIETALSMSSLIIARALDFLALGILGLFFIIWQRRNIRSLNAGHWIFTFCLIGIPMLGILLSLLWGRQIAGGLEHLGAPQISGRAKPVPKRLVLFLARIVTILSERKSGVFYMKCLGISFLLMLVRIGLFSAFAFYSHDAISPFAAPLIGLSTLVVSTIPLQGFMGVGPFEGGWVLGYVLAGRPAERGLIMAMNAHLIIIILLVVLGSLSNFILLRRR